MSSGSNFSDGGVWSFILLAAVILLSLIVANIIKRKVGLLKNSLIPVSVLGGLLLLIVSIIVKAATGTHLFNLEVFNAGRTRTGVETLEILTYHCLAIGFIAMTLRKSEKRSKTRTRDVINTGVTTVSTYLIQAVVGLSVTIIASFVIPKLLKASGLLLAFGYGQGTGQALNYGNIYEGYGFEGGKSFGLAVAAMGFLSASIVGVFYLNRKRRRGELVIRQEINELNREKVEDEGEIPMIESIDKITMEIAIIAVCYAFAYGIMFVLGSLVGEGLRATIYGFNFLFGTLAGVILKAMISFMRKTGIMKRDYINNFLLNRISGLAFDIMIVAGIGAIQIDMISSYIGVLLIIGVLGALVTFLYIKLVSFKLFPDYANEQFLAMFGMLTGTASTGVILLREVDPEFETPASENLVYQNFPAIICGFPIMLLASYAPTSDMAAYICLGAVVLIFAVLNIFLFRSVIFVRKK